MQHDLSDALDEFLQPITHRSLDIQNVNYKPSVTATDRTIFASVKVENPAKINKQTVDFNLRYIQIYTKDEGVKVGDSVIHKGVEYSLYSGSDYSDYGAYKFMGEELK